MSVLQCMCSNMVDARVNSPTFRSPVNEHFCGKMMAWCKNVDIVLQVGGMELQRVVGLTSSSTGGCKWDIGQGLRVLEQSWA